MATQLVVIRNDENNQPIDPSKAPPQMLKLADHLRSKNGKLRIREAIFHGKRVEYFKGSRAVEALLKHDPKLSSEEASAKIAALMESHNFFFRVAKHSNRSLDIDSRQYFEADAYYIWQYEPTLQRYKRMLYSGLLLGGVLVVVMFPLWPVELRTGVWYLSMLGMSLIALLLLLAVLRLMIFGLTSVVLKPGVWLFPNLFADVGVVDSFVPVWGWHGVDYERAHLEKYRKQRGGSGRRKKKTDAAGANEAESFDGKGKGKAKANGGNGTGGARVDNGKQPLLELNTDGPGSNSNSQESEDESIEEINADSDKNS